MSTIEKLALPFRPPEVVRLAVRAVYLEGQIDLRKLRNLHPEYPVLAPDPFITATPSGCFVAFTKFGSVVFWNCGESLQRGILDDLRRLMETSPAEKMEDRLDVLVGTPENAVTFNEVSLRELTVARMSIISLALAQSVALDHLEQEVSQALRQFEPVVSDLRVTGRLKLPARKALAAIGFALQVRSSVLANLTLFDKPPETWESEMLERLDNQLYDFFDLEERLSAINEKVGYFTDMSTMLTNLLNQRRSVQLELAIIFLILVEVVIFIWSMFRGQHA